MVAAGSRSIAGNMGPTSSRKRVRADSDCEAPRAKVARTGQEDEKLADLESSLTIAATILDAAMTEIRETKAEIKERKRHIKGLIAEFQDITTTVTERSIAYTTSLREEKLKKENASLRDRIKRLEEAPPEEIKRELDQESRSRRRAKPYGSKVPTDEPDIEDKLIKQGK